MFQKKIRSSIKLLLATSTICLMATSQATAISLTSVGFDSDGLEWAEVTGTPTSWTDLENQVNALGYELRLNPFDETGEHDATMERMKDVYVSMGLVHPHRAYQLIDPGFTGTGESQTAFVKQYKKLTNGNNQWMDRTYTIHQAFLSSPGRRHLLAVNVVPEPSTALLMGIGLIGISLRGRTAARRV